MQSLAASALGTQTAQPMELWQYGVLGIACMMLVAAVVYLHKEGRKREEQISTARRGWDEERAKLLESTKTELESLRATYETKHRELVERYAEELREDREAAETKLVEALNTSRREFAELMEKVADKNAQVLQATANVMEKFYGRFVGPRGRY